MNKRLQFILFLFEDLYLHSYSEPRASRAYLEDVFLYTVMLAMKSRSAIVEWQKKQNKKNKQKKQEILVLGAHGWHSR